MRFDFSQVEDVESFVSIPEGSYVCRVAEVREGLSRDSSVRWSLRLEVLEGEYAGRTAGWDGLTWSDRGVLRVRRVLEALGFEVSGEVDIQPGDLIGRCVHASFVAEEREDPLTGRRTARLRVPYAGYASLDEPLPGVPLPAVPLGGGGDDVLHENPEQAEPPSGTSSSAGEGPG